MKLLLHSPVNEMQRNETGNKIVTPVKKWKVIHVIHKFANLFTTTSGSFGTLCASYHFRQNEDDVLNFFFRRIAT